MNDDNIQNGQLVDTREHRVPDKQFFDQAKENRRIENEAETAAFNKLRQKNAERLAKNNEAFLATHNEDVAAAQNAEFLRKKLQAERDDQAARQLAEERAEARRNPLH